MITEQDIENWFTYHAPDLSQLDRYELIRYEAKKLAIAIIENTPSSADQSAAIRHLRECVMTANAAIACEEKPEPVFPGKVFEFPDFPPPSSK